MQRLSIRSMARPLFFTLAFFYILFHAMNGGQGVYALLKEHYKLNKLQQDKIAIAAKRETLERRVALMKGDTIDRDMLEEQARRFLGVAGEEEVMLLSK